MNDVDNEDNVEFESPVHEMMRNSYFYERTSVSKSRIDKFCNLCGTNIPKGSASNGAKLFYDEFYQVHFCKQCEETYKNELALMYDMELDNY